MPISKIHKEKKKQNLVTLALILGLMALIFVIALIKTSQGW